MSIILFVCNIESCASISASMFSFRAMSVRTRSAGLVGDGRVYPMSCNKTWKPSLKNKVRGSAYVKDRKLECGGRTGGEQVTRRAEFAIPSRRALNGLFGCVRIRGQWLVSRDLLQHNIDRGYLLLAQNGLFSIIYDGVH